MKRFNTLLNPLRRNRGAVAVLTLVMLIVLLGFASLTIDVGYLYNVRSELQHTADASALAAAQMLPDEAAARQTAIEYANRNSARHGNVTASSYANWNGNVVTNSNVVVGHWDAEAAVFTPGGAPADAVRVLASRSNAHGNPVSLFFAGIFGITQTEVSASATAMSAAQGGRVRFLIDNEVFDTDEPVIEDLADRLGTTSLNLLSDGNGDGFVDIPGGEVLELPTGQTGDEGLFTIGPEFEFTDSSSPSLVDFLLYDESGDRRGIMDSDLDPLLGVEPTADAEAYPTFVDPNFVHVSPLYKSDVSNPQPWVNAKGQRYGLLAFKIIGVGVDPDGAGSRLPNLIFEIVDPAGVSLDSVGVSTSITSTVSKLVQ